METTLTEKLLNKEDLEKGKILINSLKYLMEIGMFPNSKDRQRVLSKVVMLIDEKLEELK